MRPILLLAFAGSLMPDPVGAQIYLAGTLGLAEAEDRSGVTFGAGLAARMGPFVLFGTGESLMYLTEDARFYIDHLPNGQERSRPACTVWRTSWIERRKRSLRKNEVFAE